MRVTRQALMRQCAICERTVLMGERTIRFAPQEGDDFVDVCPLCQEIAVEHGWVKEGSPTSPIVPTDRRRKRRLLGGLFGGDAATEPVAPEPVLRRLSDGELAIVEAADLFNGTAFRRTVEGIARSLGEPRASIVPLSGVMGELVITVAWDISWYQYRVTPDSAQPVKLAERGHELTELETKYTDWNARVDEGGRLVPAVARL